MHDGDRQHQPSVGVDLPLWDLTASRSPLGFASIPAQHAPSLMDQWAVNNREADNLLVTVIARIVSTAFFVGFFSMILGLILVFIDRRSLRRGRIDAFRKGWLILSAEGVAAPNLQRAAGKLQTAQGEGQWLTDDAFAFWSQANNRPSSYYFGWTGLAARHGREILFEVRVLRGKAAIQAGQLLAVSSFLVLLPFADWRLALPAIVLEMALLWWLWRTFGREKDIANQIVAQLCLKFQGEWWPDASQRGI